MKNIHCNLRQDRFGSVWVDLCSKYLLSQHLKYTCSMSGSNYHSLHETSIFHKPFINHISKTKPSNIESTTYSMQSGLETLLHNTKSDFISTAKQYLDLEVVKKHKINKTTQYKDNQICIHVRLGDCKNNKVIDQSGLFKQFLLHLNKNQTSLFFSFHHEHFKKYNTQAPTCPNALNILLSCLSKKHPKKEIHLICENVQEAIFKYRPLIKKYNIKIFSSSIEEDLFHLINSDILICGQSNLSVLAMLFHNGHQVFYPHSLIFGYLGLSSEFDKTNFIDFSNNIHAILYCDLSWIEKAKLFFNHFLNKKLKKL
jgi:hypothetical protein